MQTRFVKMHGVGNDFVIIDHDSEQPLPDRGRVRELANRRTGIGFDQVLILEPPRQKDTAVFYRIFNADGDEVEQCGNGARCIASLLAERMESDAANIVMDSPAGIIEAQTRDDGTVSVNMGIPDFDPASLPFDASSESYIYNIDVAGSEIEIGAVSMGNPHAVLTVSSIDTAPVDRIGPALEHHPRFPNRTNVGFMEVVDAGHIRLRVHERGTGETQACGTGACAAVAVGHRHGVLGENVMVDLPGGRLVLSWAGPGEPIWMTGPAVKVFEGQVDL